MTVYNWTVAESLSTDLPLWVVVVWSKDVVMIDGVTHAVLVFLSPPEWHQRVFCPEILHLDLVSRAPIETCLPSTALYDS